MDFLQNASLNGLAAVRRASFPIFTMKNILLIWVSLFALAACTEEQQLKRKIDGTYTVKSFNAVYEVMPSCQGQSFTSFAVENPGEIVFTGKKTIDGPISSRTSRPYYGYLDYNFRTVNHEGDSVVITERTYFQYEVVEGTIGSLDTTLAFIYFDSRRYDLEVVYDDNKVAAFRYRIDSGDQCLRAMESHVVR